MVKTTFGNVVAEDTFRRIPHTIFNLPQYREIQSKTLIIHHLSVFKQIEIIIKNIIYNFSTFSLRLSVLRHPTPPPPQLSPCSGTYQTLYISVDSNRCIRNSPEYFFHCYLHIQCPDVSLIWAYFNLYPQHSPLTPPPPSPKIFGPVVVIRKVRTYHINSYKSKGYVM